jgi:hypothetical protein
MLILSSRKSTGWTIKSRFIGKWPDDNRRYLECVAIRSCVVCGHADTWPLFLSFQSIQLLLPWNGPDCYDNRKKWFTYRLLNMIIHSREHRKFIPPCLLWKKTRVFSQYFSWITKVYFRNLGNHPDAVLKYLSSLFIRLILKTKE